MIVAFFTHLGNKKVDVSLNGEIVSFTLPRDNWTIIDGVVDPSQVIGYKNILKEGSTQIYADRWSNRKTLPFGSGSPLKIMSRSGRIDSRTFDSLVSTNADAIAERNGTEILSPQIDASLAAVFDIFGKKMLDLQARFKNDKNSDAFAAGIYAAQVEFISTMYGKLSKYGENRFQNDRHAEIFSNLNGNIIDIFMKQDFTVDNIIAIEQILRQGGRQDRLQSRYDI